MLVCQQEVGCNTSFYLHEVHLPIDTIKRWCTVALTGTLCKHLRLSCCRCLSFHLTAYLTVISQLAGEARHQQWRCRCLNSASYSLQAELVSDTHAPERSSMLRLT